VPSARTRLLIVDDHPVVREGLRAVFGRRPEFEIVGEAADGEAAVDLFGRLHPDVTIIDLRLPVLSGIEAIGAIRRLDPKAHILALTSFGTGIEVRRALDAGVSGFLLKGTSGDDVIAAVRRVRGGGKVIAPEAVEQLLATPPGPPLGRREMEVLELLALGLRNQEIADRLGLALGTVKIYVTRVLETLGAKDRTEAVTLALRQGRIRLS
jgi:two-component system NarL family response regulator